MPARIELQPGQLMPNTRLTYLDEAGMRGKVRWCQFQCSCGTTIERPLAWVRHGNTSSCGCFRSDYVADKNTKHSHAPRNKQSGAYRSWQAMHQRVKVDPNYANISICNRWNDFENFIVDMGDRPKDHTIERKDNKGNYEPSNCVWATKLEQAQNMTQTKLITIGNDTRSINEWCRIKGIGYYLVKQRRRRGMSIEDAISTPVDPSKSHKRK